MDLHLSPQTLSSFSAIDESYGRLGIIINDIHSFEKELRLWNEDHKEGAQLVNMVDTMAKDTGLSYEASKRVLWIWCREWELKHQDLVKERLAAKDGDREDLKIYLNALEYVLGGNEYWSETTQRYHWKD